MTNTLEQTIYQNCIKKYKKAVIDLDYDSMDHEWEYLMTNYSIDKVREDLGLSPTY